MGWTNVGWEFHNNLGAGREKKYHASDDHPSSFRPQRRTHSRASGANLYWQAENHFHTCSDRNVGKKIHTDNSTLKGRRGQSLYVMQGRFQKQPRQHCQKFNMTSNQGNDITRSLDFPLTRCRAWQMTWYIIKSVNIWKWNNNLLIINFNWEALPANITFLTADEHFPVPQPAKRLDESRLQTSICPWASLRPQKESEHLLFSSGKIKQWKAGLTDCHSGHCFNIQALLPTLAPQTRDSRHQLPAGLRMQ